ncbi:MAG: amidohydrolase [Candidatus Marinimicrobia bacterium]|nr:amidohydrolase [Candidatus Neomarinimicrobiota bacterium]MDP7121776.1 amidohydrolase [Candidatus Neomarinimicrobiota bacterium]MDP7436385.1 amidohydrolase [Candidatus Neomarinimicrobiota bacterium]
MEPADLVLLNGKILTVDEQQPEAEALAARGDTIVALGSSSEIRQYVGEETEVIDLEGYLAIPGFIEGHGHYYSLGASLMELELRYTNSWAEIVSLVAQAAREARPGEWIVGRGWHQDKWDRTPEPNIEGLPFHHQLSAVSPDNPVFLSHTSGHGVFVNAAAMEVAGITSRSVDPPGGEIVRDDKGDPVGMLRESAAQPARDALARYKAERSEDEIEIDMRQQVRLAAQNALENGITSFHDMGSTWEELDLLKVMAEEGNLPVRLYMAIQEPASEMKSRLDDYRIVGYGNNYLTIRCIGEKVLDGALGTHGGWLLEPYTDLPRSYGLNVTPVPEIRQSAELAISHDYQMAIQGIGDRAARELFNIYEKQFREHPEKKDLRWRIEHAQVTHPDDLPRYASLGVIPGIQGIFACSDGPWVTDRLGERRTEERGYIFRSMVESGAVVMNGTDPPVEEIDPIASFHCSIARQLSDGSIFQPEQRMTREQTLRSYTINNAYAAFEENFKGSLELGKLADVTVLSKDIMTVPEDEILETEIVYTIIGGKIKFKKSD